MATVGNFFASAFDQAIQGNINWPSHTINVALLTSTASPNLNTWVHYSDLTNEVAAGNGYSTGGAAISSKTHTITAANSWGVTWAASTAYNAGDLVIPAATNGLIYQCTIAGTSGASHPTWPTVVGDSVADNTATWTALGESIQVLSSAAVSWTVPASGSLAFQYAAFYDANTGTGSTEPLVGIVNFGATQTFSAPAGGPLTAQVAPYTFTGGSVTAWFATSPA